MLQLFCIPYAGGTSASYNTLTQFLAGEPIDVIAWNTPDMEPA